MRKCVLCHMRTTKVKMVNIIKSLINSQPFIRIITIHGEWGGHLLESLPFTECGVGIY